MRLKTTRFGESAEGIELSGNPESCEPDHVRITFPGGDVEVVRATDGANPDYWVHVRINHREDGMFVPGETMPGALCDARLDIHGKDIANTEHGDFEHPGLYHLAVRVKPAWSK